MHLQLVAESLTYAHRVSDQRYILSAENALLSPDTVITPAINPQSLARGAAPCRGPHLRNDLERILDPMRAELAEWVEDGIILISTTAGRIDIMV